MVRRTFRSTLEENVFLDPYKLQCKWKDRNLIANGHDTQTKCLTLTIEKMIMN